jgi:hypothetical protein
VVLAADHRLASKQSIRLKDLATEPYVMFEGPGSRRYFEELLAAHGIDPPIAYVSNSLQRGRQLFWLHAAGHAAADIGDL